MLRSLQARWKITRRPGPALPILLAASVLASCSPSGRSLDLLDAAPKILREGNVAGQGRDWILEQLGSHRRLKDVLRAALPAGPASRTVFAVEVPGDARLWIACGIAQEYHSAPGVEFTVKVRSEEKEDVVWTRLLNPISKAAHRRWVPAEVDLSDYGGQSVDIVFETTGYEEGDSPTRAFWGTPTLVTARARDAPLVIVYLVDSVRADHTTPYGYERDTTPELQAFAGDSVVFDRALAASGWTKPSVASLFTSQLPGRHGVMQLPDRLDEGYVTLAEMLKSSGYSTGAVVANLTVYSPNSGFEQGFDLFAGMRDAEGRRSKVVDAARMVDTSLDFIDARRGLPTFLYVHTMDAHVPYLPPEPFDRLYGPAPTAERPAFDPRLHYQTPEDLERVVAQYDGCIAYGDREFGRFVSELRARGLYDRALIVFLADHGEEFLDHGRWTHSKSVFDELVHVPLVVKRPGRPDAGQRISEQVQLLDLLPFILQNEGLPVPSPPAIVGQPLTFTPGGEGRLAILQNTHRGYTAYGAGTSEDKYVRRLNPEDEELYFDLVDDPGERVDRLEEAEDRVRELRDLVESTMPSNPFDFVVQFEGDGLYEITLRSNGWIERLETGGLGPSDGAAVEDEGHRLSLRVRSGPDEPRRVVFGLRPRGAPVWLEGTRDGKPLPASAVRMTGEAVSPEELPCRLPDIERPDIGAAFEHRMKDVFAPPAPGRGVAVWLKLAAGQEVMTFGSEAQEQLKALGYIND